MENKLNLILQELADMREMLEQLAKTKPLDLNKEFISVEELAQWLNYTPKTVHQKCNTNDLPFYKIGNRALFKVSEIRKMIEENRIAPLSERVALYEAQQAARRQKVS